MALKSYRAKRDFRKTPEPASTRAARRAAGTARRFVVQKHAASHLHYDFRLELDGVLKSWAVPKGPPFAKGEKRLAMEVEDHPVSYLEFEGVIPQGQYGGGTVMVWDIGTFEPLGAAPLKDLAAGKLHVLLSGKKLKGEWYLVRTRRGDARNQWLLIRGGADMKPVSRRADDTSALSGKSMKALSEPGKSARAATPRATPQTSRRATNVTRTPSPKTSSPKTASRTSRPSPQKFRTKSGPLLPFFEPMMARLLTTVPPGEWHYEIKLDGYRALAFVDETGHATLLSRNNKNFSAKFPEVVESLGKLKTRNTVIDGEIVAMDPRGVTSFQLLQQRERGEDDAPLFYYAFDLPQYEGEDLRDQPLETRRGRLETLLRKPVGVLRVSETVGTEGADLLEQAARLGLEGLIGKRAGSRYEAGRRSGAWVKVKTHREQEFVVGGFTEPQGGRRHFGALLVGVYEGRKLMFTGKVGTGFAASRLRDLHRLLQPLERTACPFGNLPEARAGRYGSGLTAAEMKRCHWVDPVVVVQVRFTEWTRDGKLRHPVFVGVREDKKATAVRREEATDG